MPPTSDRTKTQGKAGLNPNSYRISSAFAPMTTFSDAGNKYPKPQSQKHTRSCEDLKLFLLRKTEDKSRDF